MDVVASAVPGCSSWGALGSTHRDSSLQRLLMSMMSHASVHGCPQSLHVALVKKFLSARCGHSHPGLKSFPYCLNFIILTMSLSRFLSFLCL
jgi:hypothetical protein